MSSLIEKIGFTNKQAFGLCTIILLLIGGMVLPESAYEYFFSGTTELSKDIIQEEIEAYIDQDLGGSPWQTELDHTHQINVVDVGGTPTYYVLNGSSGKLWASNTNYTTLIRWVIGNTTAGNIFHRNGEYVGVITLSLKNDITIEGEDKYKTIIKQPDLLNDSNTILIYRSNNTVLRNIGFDGNSVNDGGAVYLTAQRFYGNGIYIDSSHFVTVESVLVQKTVRVGLEMTTTDFFGDESTNVWIEDTDFIDCDWNGITITGNYADGGVGEVSTVISNVYITMASDVGLTLWGARGVEVIGGIIENNTANDHTGENSHWGLSVESEGNQAIFSHMIVRDQFVGFKDNSVNNNSVRFIDMIISGNDNHGFVLEAGGQDGYTSIMDSLIYNNGNSSGLTNLMVWTKQEVEIIGNVFSQETNPVAGVHNVWIRTADNVRFAYNRLNTNRRNADGNLHLTDSNNTIIIGNRMQDTQVVQTTGYALDIDNGHNLTIKNNDFTAWGTTATPVHLTGINTNIVWDANIGWATESNGISAAIGDGGNIAHGLAGTPTMVQLTLLNITDPRGVTPEKVHVAWDLPNSGTTNISVDLEWANCTSIPSGMVVSWLAEYNAVAVP